MRRVAAAIRRGLVALLRPAAGTDGRCLAGASARPPAR